MTRSSHHLIDPAYSPHIIISRRLREANKLHVSRLAERCTVQSASRPLTEEPSPVVHPLAQLAVNRTSCALDDGLTGGSSTPASIHLVTDVKLTPLERAAPHRIVVPTDVQDTYRGESDGSSPQLKSSTWNAITALSTLCDEVAELERTFSMLIPALVLFSAPQVTRLDEEGEKIRHSALLKAIGKFMPTLQLVSNGCVRLKRLVKNMVVQLGGCAAPSQMSEGEAASEEDTPVLGSGVSLLVLGKAVGTALRVLITVDEAIEKNDDLREAWGMYKDVVMDHSEEKRAANELENKFEALERMMIQLDYNLMTSRSFTSAIEQNFDPSGRFQAANFNLHEEIHSIVGNLYGQYCERINTEHEATERLDCVGVYAMYVLYRHLLPTKCVPDPKLHKNLWSVFPAMCPVLELYGPLHFIPREFIMIHAPYEAVKGCSADINNITQGAASLVLKWDGSFKARVNKIRLDALSWMAIADAELSSTVEEDGSGEEFDVATSVETIERATSCILRGIRILHSAAITLRSQLIAHKALGLDQNLDCIASCLSLMAVLKSVEKMFRVRRRTAVLAFQRGTLKMIASNIFKRFENIRSYVDQYSTSELSRSPEHAKSFARVSACLSALEGILKGSCSFSPIRRYSISLIVASCMDSAVLGRFANEDMLAVEGHLNDLYEISSIEEILDRACDCSFMYFYRDLYPSIFDYLFDKSLTSINGNAHLVLSALSDPDRILRLVKHIDTDTTVCDYQSYLLQCMRERLVVPLCEVLDSNLRGAYHSKTIAKQESGDHEGFDNRNVRSLLLSEPFYICQKRFDLKAEVEGELGRAFYSLCALSLNDSNAYNEMRSTANERYGLSITDPYLPNGILDQRFDALEIVRDFESFVAGFTYNLMEQVFVERKPEPGAKFLANFGIECITSSIARHGNGVVKSAIDAAYKILSQKFHQFIEYLSNDYVKSLLAKEYRWFHNDRSNGGSFYPYDRAVSFAREINKLEGDGSSSLDKCRALLGIIGNTVAFVRLVRAASKKSSSDEMPYVSRKTFGVASQAVSCGQRGENAQILNQISDSDHIRALVDEFKNVSKESSVSSTNCFFCFVPALCLNWLDASSQGKEVMLKKNITRDGYFTDDGFAVGLTFCLVVTEQIKQYESLHWFKSVQNKYAIDDEDLIEKERAKEVKMVAKRAANKQSSWFSAGVETPADDNDEATVLKMTRKRLEGNKREMATLFFTMHAAERLFCDYSHLLFD